MIYCIGNKLTYDEFLSEGSAPEKKGRFIQEDGTLYPGSSVWLTKKEAQAYCSDDSDGLDVYGVVADWEKDTVPSEDGPWHDLLVDCLLVFLEK